jgi:hypothetical protein
MDGNKIVSNWDPARSASWHYAVHKDLLRLRTEGARSSVLLVERYAHLLPAPMQWRAQRRGATVLIYSVE